jgi:hypothetical protein
MDLPLGRSQGSRTGRCKGLTARGAPCRKPPMHGREVCKQHSDDPNKGRRTLLTPELTAEIVRRLSIGAYVHDVMQSLGLQRQTFYAWTERGEADKEAGRETVFADFADATKRARAEARVTAVGYVRQAMASDWRAAMTFLERTDPEHWSRRRRVGHFGHVRTSAPEIPDDEARMREVAAMLREVGALPDEEG